VRILSWNLQGLRKSDLAWFIERLDEELEWDVIALQEFGAEFTQRQLDNFPHKIFYSPRRPGIRPFGFIVHQRLVPFLIPDSFEYSDRSGAVNFRVHDFSFRVVVAHLPSGNNLEEYEDSLEAVRQLCLKKRKDAKLFFCVDANAQMGERSLDERCLGNFS